MPRVLISDKLSPAGIEILEKTPGIEVVVNTDLSPEQVREELKNFDGIIIRSGTKLTAEVLDGQPRLKAVARAGVGVDNVDLPTATRQGIVVMNTPAGNTISTAEQTLALMYAMSRNTVPAATTMKGGGWDRKKFTGSQMAGKTLGIIGLGRIGLAVAKRAIAMEMNVIGYDPFLTAEKAAEHGIEFCSNVADLVPQADYITVHTPLTDETRGLIDAEMLEKAKPGVRLVNCARGGIIDEDALADALESGKVAAAALDVFTSEPPPEDFRLRTIDNALLTPHLGASTDEAQELVALEAAELMVGYLTRGEIRQAVNTAAVSGAEMADTKVYLELGYRLGLLIAQLNKGRNMKRATLTYRGEAASKKYKLITSAFACGLLKDALQDPVNIVNADMLARERGIELVETSRKDPGDFATRVGVTVETDQGELSADGTMLGRQYLRLIRLGDFTLDSFLDGTLLIYHHRDVPGLIGFVGSVLGKHDVNIANMSLGRKQATPGGDSVAILNVDSAPPAEAVKEIGEHAEVTGVQVVKLPPHGEEIPGVTS
ncbi:phosphoglycerate dehydrogenase [Stratiformator vulcanicus]|uniref:D-3-phosphoglycerate dehydrogenase n=1 Tax=Stratiformator vulcanicus TaxID=2527980 RepID=A0A517QX16_9PLAN|nr:phosphoglycerate dehydrogenase [Stratiformator vulcanicus]QDT36137.1 D-3-phosphoglycerate dehydrogenase [Stratiformator vulcanicus]